LPVIREVAMRFNFIAPIFTPIPVPPAAHYTMGGIHTDIDGATPVPGIWAAGEAACVSLHGANRLGSNSTAECLVWGKITGKQAAAYISRQKSFADVTESVAVQAESDIFKRFNSTGKENAYVLRDELHRTMDTCVGVFRTEVDLIAALNKIHELKVRLPGIRVADRSRIYNTDLLNALEISNLLDLSEVVVAGALARKESRGAHARRDYKERNDTDWLKHTLAYHTADGPRLEYISVTINMWTPVERKY